ncbi:Protein of unknown function [Actinopolyspora mzabensis]|uniref:DUF3097 domain-containing protein n=1 Tax=Actinopolyspora mzabensis TaxID=995066 RepID=A0A1G8YC56_ACTMZ|nr:DUF3097 domain-containing protein [Actinopolyspora mzabensis]SDK00489.1 Protein of unknown function [Actinopolyspora mzabensis]
MRSIDYGRDVLTGTARRRRRTPPELPAEPGTVVEDAAGEFCGAIVRLERGEFTKHNVILEDRHGRQRAFPMRTGGFRHEGGPVTLVPVPSDANRVPSRSASGSVTVSDAPARTARASRIWVEGLHDAELLERVWGHDLRVAGVVVEPLHGIDDLERLVTEFAPGPRRRLGVLVDHFVTGSKESRIAERVDAVDALVTGHPFVDIWQAVRPETVGLTEWPEVDRSLDWKTGVCRELGWADPSEGWRRILDAVSDFRDLRAPLLGAVEHLVDFVTLAEE